MINNLYQAEPLYSLCRTSSRPYRESFCSAREYQAAGQHFPFNTKSSERTNLLFLKFYLTLENFTISYELKGPLTPI